MAEFPGWTPVRRRGPSWSASRLAPSHEHGPAPLEDTLAVLIHNLHAEEGGGTVFRISRLEAFNLEVRGEAVAGTHRPQERSIQAPDRNNGALEHSDRVGVARGNRKHQGSVGDHTSVDRGGGVRRIRMEGRVVARELCEATNVRGGQDPLLGFESIADG